MFSPGAKTKTQIQEANKHLQLLHSKIDTLERDLAEKEVLFGEREKQLSDALEYANHSNETHTSELRQNIEQQNVDIALLTDKLQEKDALIARLQHKCEVLDYIGKHKHVLEEIVSVLSGVQRLDQKYQPSPRPDPKLANGVKDDSSMSTKHENTQISNDLSKKTEAHGISETSHVGSTSSVAHSYRTFDGRFSISEVDEEDDQNPDGLVPDDVFSKCKSQKELYL